MTDSMQEYLKNSLPRNPSVPRPQFTGRPPFIASILEKAEVSVAYCLSEFNKYESYTPEVRTRTEKLLEDMDALRLSFFNESGRSAANIIVSYDENIKEIARRQL